MSDDLPEPLCVESGIDLIRMLLRVARRTFPTTRILNLQRHETNVAEMPESSDVLGMI